jgi:hypothetical protein
MNEWMEGIRKEAQSCLLNILSQYLPECSRNRMKTSVRKQTACYYNKHIYILLIYIFILYSFKFSVAEGTFFHVTFGSIINTDKN